MVHIIDKKYKYIKDGPIKYNGPVTKIMKDGPINHGPINPIYKTKNNW